MPQQHAFGDETDLGFRRRDVFETDLVTDFAAEFHAEFLRDACGEQSRGEPSRLQNYDLPVTEQSRLQKHLRHLRGFAGAGRRRKIRRLPVRSESTICEWISQMGRDVSGTVTESLNPGAY